MRTDLHFVQTHRHADEREPDAIVLAVVAQPHAARTEAIAVGAILDDDLDDLAARDERRVTTYETTGAELCDLDAIIDHVAAHDCAELDHLTAEAPAVLPIG